MESKTVLVTGGCGFIGSNIVDKLLEINTKKVIVIDNLFSGFEENISNHFGKNNFEFIKGDIRDYDLIKKITKNVDIICHQAAWGSVPRSIKVPREYHENNVLGFFNILEAARENGVKRIIYASSSSVYGDNNSLPKKEENIGNALSPYAASKFIDEIYAQVYSRCYGIELIGLRYFNVFGPKQNPAGAYAAVIPKFINNILEKEEIIVNGDGNFSRDFTFIENVVNFNIKCMLIENKNALNTVYNVACGERNTLNDLLKILEDELGKGKVTYGEERMGDIPHSLASIQKGQVLIEYNPEIKFEEGIKRTIEYFKIKKNKN